MKVSGTSTFNFDEKIYTYVLQFKFYKYMKPKKAIQCVYIK